MSRPPRADSPSRRRRRLATTATCQEWRAAFTAHYQGSGRGLREGVCGGGPLGAEDEGQLPLWREVAIGRPKRRAGAVQLERAEVVLHEKAVVAVRLASRRHVTDLPHFAPGSHARNSQIRHFCFTRSLQGFHLEICKERGNQELGSGPCWTCARVIAPQPAQPSSCMPRSISRRKISSTSRTPCSPAAARPQSTGRPISAALAPSASAFRTSVPRRTPPST